MNRIWQIEYGKSDLTYQDFLKNASDINHYQHTERTGEADEGAIFCCFFHNLPFTI